MRETTRKAGLPPRLIVFDLDGTLIDSQRDIADAANAMLRNLGGTPLPADVIAPMVGEGAAMLVKRALARAGLQAELEPALAAFLDIYRHSLLVHTRPYEGIPEVLARLA